MDLEKQLQSTPGDHGNWPMLKLRYRASEQDVAAVLPPGFEPGARPEVTLTVYNVPVNGEPEHGLLTTVRCAHGGREGEFALGYAIDKEAEIFISQEKFGQPKYPAEIKYFRIGDKVEGRATHQGYTFLEFEGEVKGTLPNRPDTEQNEWWIKSSRAVGGAEKSYDFPPHVVRVHSVASTSSIEKVEGKLTLRDSPWDPIALLLPQRELISAALEMSVHKSRDITLEGKLDPDAFWPYADTISGSRWPGHRGGPRR